MLVVLQLVLVTRYSDRWWCSMVQCKVQGLPIGNCAGSSNNLVLRGTKLSAIDMTAEAFFERLYLVLGFSPFEPRVNCPYAPTPPLFSLQLFLDFRAFFSPSDPSIFCSARFTK